MRIGETDSAAAIERHGSLTVFDDKAEAVCYMRDTNRNERMRGDRTRVYVAKDTE